MSAPSALTCLAEYYARLLRLAVVEPTPTVILAGQRIVAKIVVAESPLQGNGALEEVL